MNAVNATLWPDDTIQRNDLGLTALLGGRIQYIVPQMVLNASPDFLTRFRTQITDFILMQYNGHDPVMVDRPDLIAAMMPATLARRLDALMSTLSMMASRKMSAGVNLANMGSHSPTFEVCRRTSSPDQAELRALVYYASERGLLRVADSNQTYTISLTGDGLDYLDAQALTASTSRIAFVAMWFNDATQAAYLDGMKPAIEANGYESLRIDAKEHSNKIDDEIIADIRRCRFVVADFSCGEDGARGGVYFEAGFAMGLEKKVIWTVRKQDLARVHFDTRQYNFVDWSDTAELRERLTRRIGAVVGAA